MCHGSGPRKGKKTKKIKIKKIFLIKKNKNQSRFTLSHENPEVLACHIGLKLSSAHASDGPAPLTSHFTKCAVFLALEAPEFATLILEQKS